MTPALIAWAVCSAIAIGSTIFACRAISEAPEGEDY
jgi:hypothetical protein